MDIQKDTDTRMPTIMIPFSEKGRPEYHDIFVYLRPETNGILVESIMLKVIQENPLYKSKIKIVYLANLPGDFIVRKRIVQNHYKVKLYFTGKGKSSFTPYMRQTFEHHFRTNFDSAKVIGAFAALEIFKMDYQQLFDVWVERRDMLVVNGQSIKKYKDYYIINYDLPAILHKNNTGTDIAVMVFRSELDYVDFYGMITRMEIALKRENILGDKAPVSRAFHYSKGPFEQMLDASGYLYDQNGNNVPLGHNSFYQYLNANGFTDAEIRQSIDHPIMRFCIADNFELEDDIKIFTAGDTYSEAHSKLLQVKRQYLSY